jgi:hypothetical protein
VELGIYSFVEIPLDANNRPLMSGAERLRNLMEEIELADSLGLDFFGLGEHHRPEYIVSSPAVVLSCCGGEDEADQIKQRGHRHQQRRSGACVSGFCHCRSALQRKGGDHGGARFVH